MFELDGKYNTAKVFTDVVDNSTIGQIIALCNNQYFENCRIRMMPDTHYGKGSTVGTTMSLKDCVLPSLIGSDIGCGVTVVALKEKRLELPKFDSMVKEAIKPSKNASDETSRLLKDFVCKKFVHEEKAILNMGTLGGGNHFIEVDKDEEGNLYILIHSGSRSVGKNVEEFYMNEMRKQKVEICTGKLFEDYLHDMVVCQEYASMNRRNIARKLLKSMKIHEFEEMSFESIHNYIDTTKNILRKGAISAELDERLIIPINMKDGALICIGKGNEDWNYSAPHGAGRLYSRSESKSMFTLKEFKKSMEGIYSSSVGTSTIDECPMVYKSLECILENIVPTVQIEKLIRPIYNFKQSDNA